MEEQNSSFGLYVKNSEGGLEEIYKHEGNNNEECRTCLECDKCKSRKENEEDIIERVKKLGKTN